MSMIAITYIGHATTLIRSGESVVLTDPLFSERVFFAKRQEPINIDLGRLPELSAIVISHAHFDHLDLNAFRYIKSNVPVFVPGGVGRLASKYIRNPIIELDPYSSHTLSNGTEITATEARHRGFRISGLRYRRCNGYVLKFKNGEKAFFAGYTGYGEHFKEICANYSGEGPINVALLPITSYAPKWFMQKHHLNPTEALEAFLDLGAEKMVPIHFGTFKLSSEKMDEPIEWLKRVSSERNLSENIVILKSGETAEI